MTLPDLEIAMAAEALVENRYDKIPEHIRDHIANCQSCRIEILALVDILLEYNRREIAKQIHKNSRE
jgi:hypothetical protein